MQEQFPLALMMLGIMVIFKIEIIWWNWDYLLDIDVLKNSCSVNFSQKTLNESAQAHIVVNMVVNGNDYLPLTTILPTTWTCADPFKVFWEKFTEQEFFKTSSSNKEAQFHLFISILKITTISSIISARGNCSCIPNCEVLPTDTRWPNISNCS